MLPVYQLSQGYNDDNQPTSTQTSSIAGGQSTPGYTFTQGYDTNTGVLVGLSNNLGATPNVASLLLNENALPASLTYYTSAGSSSLASEQFTYDGDLRPQTATATWGSGSGSSGQIFSQGLWYDAAGNVTSDSTTQAAVPGQSGTGGNETENFCYNEQNKLIWASNTTAPSPGSNDTCGSQTPFNSLNGASYTSSYVYTNLGQLWQGPVAGGSTNYQYVYCNTAPHQLSGLYPIGSTCANKSGAVYKSSDDAWGNVTGRTYNGNSETLAYDELDQMVKASLGGGNSDYFAYDASGDRTVQRATSGGVTTLTVYAFGLEEYQYSGTGTLQNATHYYSLGGQLIGELTGLSTPSTNMFLTDLLSSVLATFSNTAGSAKLSGNQVYGPYGNSLYSGGSIDTNIGYTGQYSDPLTGLDYYISRYYDPVVGVFLSADAVQGNMSGMNPYAYVDGNPETYNDPTGQAFQDPGRGGSGGTGGSSGGMSNPGSGGSTGGSSGLGSGLGDVLEGIVTTAERTTEKIAAFVDTEALPAIEAGAEEVGIDILAAAAAAAGAVLAPVMIVGAAILMLLTSPTATGNSDLPASFYHTWEPPDGPPVTKPSPVGGGVGNNQGGPPATSGATGEPCSFTPNTQVATANGEQPIGKLHVGEQVWAYNPKTHKMELQPIEHVWIHKDSDLVNLTITYQTPAQHGKADSKGQTETNEVIHTTSEHPFYTTEHGFVPAGKLKVGMHTLRADDAVGIVTQTQIVHRTQTMYNLEVARDHTFVVGSGQWVVHNQCSNNDRSQLRSSLRSQGTLPRGYEAHHILPCEFQQNPVVMKAVSEGLRFNSYMNGIGLPATQALSDMVNLPLHEGSHPDYSSRVGQRLSDIEEELSETYGNFDSVDDGVTYKAVEGLINNIRDTIIEAGSSCSVNDLIF